MSSPQERQQQVIAQFAAMGIKPKQGDGLKPWERSSMKPWQRAKWIEAFKEPLKVVVKKIVNNKPKEGK